MIRSAEVEYGIENRIWMDRIDGPALATKFLWEGTAKLWVEPGPSRRREVRGFVVGNDRFGPEIGLALDQEQRESSYTFGLLFLMGGAGLSCYGGLKILGSRKR